jgi:hypothetical protein
MQILASATRVHHISSSNIEMNSTTVVTQTCNFAKAFSHRPLHGGNHCTSPHTVVDVAVAVEGIPKVVPFCRSAATSLSGCISSQIAGVRSVSNTGVA